MCVDHPRERHATPLPADRLGEQTAVLSEKRAGVRSGAVQKIWVFQLVGLVMLRCKNVYSTKLKAIGDCSRNVNIHVQANAQESRPRALSRVTSGDSPAS